jgi:hypothetical protein
MIAGQLTPRMTQLLLGRGNLTVQLGLAQIFKSGSREIQCWQELDDRWKINPEIRRSQYAQSSSIEGKALL